MKNNKEKPRYSRLSDMIDLVLYIQTKPLGVTLKEIQIRYNVSRRTAERMRDGLLCIIPDMDEIETFTKEKHWGFTNYSQNKLVSIGSS